jgi:transcription elongation factor Elf1
MTVSYNCYGTPIYDAYDEDEWRTKDFTCPKCGWRGNPREMSGPNLFRELMDFECPKCEKMLLIVGYATYQETLEAAARGNEHAKCQLGVMSGEGEHWEAFKRMIEACNDRKRQAWLKFDGPKKYYVKTPEGYEELDTEAATKLLEAN